MEDIEMDDIIEIEMDDNTDVTSQYKEKQWGKDENGLKVVDGYSFRGKQSFLKVVEGFRNILKRGKENDFNGTKFKALDIRKQGNGLEIDIEIKDKSDRGKAVIKLYGPSSKKKESVVMVTKYKESDSKYVTKLTDNVLKPMMQKMLNQVETRMSLKKSVSTKVKKQKVLKCPFCEVTSHSSPGLKGHITKKHQNVTNEEEKFCSTIVNSLLEEMIEIVDVDPKEISLEENSEAVHDMQGKYKKYKDKCEHCNYCVESDKRYAVIKTMMKHKQETCSKQFSGLSKCKECDFETNNRLTFKRHMRDTHDTNTASTSPPPKRKRKTQIQAEIEKTEDMKVENPSTEEEKMEIDESNKTEEVISRVNDENIPTKENENMTNKGILEPNKDNKGESNNQNEMKKVIKEKQKIEEEYFKCEKELALKTEECEKLKIEIKDLKQLLHLKSQVQNLDINSTQEITKSEGQNLQNETEKKMDKTRSWKTVMSRKKKRHHTTVNKEPELYDEEEEYNCNGCDFQCSTKDHLEKHINIKHRMTCRICEEVFESKGDLMVHRKLKHANYVATCKNFIADKCPFADSKCWWNHALKQSVSAEVKCFICDEKFENKPSMMTHRKKKHYEIIRQCIQYERNSCRFKEESCWFKHENTKQADERSTGSNLVFQKVSGNLRPPIKTQASAPKPL